MKNAAWTCLTFLLGFLFALEASLPPQDSDPGRAELERLVKEGKKVFHTHCQSCHGKEGKHPVPLFSLNDDDWRHGTTFEDIKANVSQGILGTAMLGFEGRLTPEEIEAVTHYVRSFLEESKSPRVAD